MQWACGARQPRQPCRWGGRPGLWRGTRDPHPASPFVGWGTDPSRGPVLVAKGSLPPEIPVAYE